MDLIEQKPKRSQAKIKILKATQVILVQFKQK